MNTAYIQGVGVAAPGLPDWHHAQPILRGQHSYVSEPLPKFSTSRLPRNEARRMGACTKLAFRAAEQACAGHDAGNLSTVFASAAADIGIADRNCTAINTPTHAVSPTHFHNSVHNAAAGYWSIATGSRAPATSLSGGRDSFAVALCEAWAMLATDGNPVLLVCFDAVGSGMLQDAWHDIHDSLALALLLSPHRDGALASLTRPERTHAAATTLTDATLEQFRQRNPAAHGLALLAALANRGNQRLVLQSSQGNLQIDLQCPA